MEIAFLVRPRSQLVTPPRGWLCFSVVPIVIWPTELFFGRPATLAVTSVCHGVEKMMMGRTRGMMIDTMNQNQARVPGQGGW